MEPPLRGVATSRHPTPPDRYLSISLLPPSSVGDELTEDDIFASSAEPASPRSPNIHHHHHHEPRHHLTNFGILAALPASETRSVFNHKAYATSPSSSSSSSRMIPMAHHHPRRPPLIENKAKMLHQSAPVNVPILSAMVEKERRRRRDIDHSGDGNDDDEDDEFDVRMLPPHEVVDARETPVVACSVLEGFGRTLKGRDLRRVRNAVWRKTGIKVQVKCDHVKKLFTTTTEQDGSFKIDVLPLDHPSSIDCLAKIVGGPYQLYISRRNQDSKIVEVHGDDNHYYYTLSKTLNFYKSNPYEPETNTKTVGGKRSQFGFIQNF